MNNYENLYGCLKDSEDLFMMFEGMTGNWEKDKVRFIKAQKELEKIANITEVND